MDSNLDGHGAPYGLSLRQRKDFVIVVTGYKKVREAVDFNDLGNSTNSGKNESFPCNTDEYQCAKSQFDDRHYMSTEQAAPRCIWSKLRCDYHQNCGAGHESDETGCGYFRQIGGIHERQVLTKSLTGFTSFFVLTVLNRTGEKSRENKK